MSVGLLSILFITDPIHYCRPYAGLDRGTGSIDRANILKSLLKHMLRCIVYQNIVAIESRLRLSVRDGTANLLCKLDVANLYDEVITPVNHLIFCYYMRRLMIRITSCTLGSGQNGQLILTIGIKLNSEIKQYLSQFGELSGIYGCMSTDDSASVPLDRSLH